ncbi:hypothetical protein JT359_03605 [Candidatus Poribacteria bacterium]|nr:hypothetical protein [Candidatus Poribacteria bacterium]
MKIKMSVVLTFSLCMVVSCVQTTKTPVTKYEGPLPQTPETILRAFTFDNVSIEWLQACNERYPPMKWIQRILDKDIVFEDTNDFHQYMMLLRSDLMHLERIYISDPEKWLPKMYFGTIYEDWKSFEDAHIDRQIWKYQQTKAAKLADPTVVYVEFLGHDGRTVLPLPEKSVVIKRGMKGYGGGSSNRKFTEQQMFDIVFKGKHPWGWKVVYTDDMGNILPKKPPPISREELELPADVPWPPKNQEHLDRIYEDVRKGRYKNIGNNR